jgi:hypothetical protein
MSKYLGVVCLLIAVVAVSAAGAAALTGIVVWKAGFENGDCYPEIKNFERHLVQNVADRPSPHVDVAWQTQVVHSGKYAEREHTTRDPEHVEKGASHRGYAFQSWRSTNGAPIPTPVVVTAWVYLEKFDTQDWFSLMTLISTPTEGYPQGSIITLDTTPALEPVIWCRRKTQDPATPAFHIEQTGRPKTKLPLNKWVKLQVYLDFNGPDGAVKVWQDDALIIDAPKAEVGPKSPLEKGHFGLYCGGNVHEITMYNDDLSVETLAAAPAGRPERRAASGPPQADSRDASDANRARQVGQRSQPSEQLKPQEKADLDRAMQLRQKQGAGGGQGGSRGRTAKEPPRPIAWDPAPLPEVKLPTTRPRIWFTAADLPVLRKRCQTTHAGDLQALQKNAEAGGGRSGVAAFCLAFLYQMTGEAKYAQQAIRLACEVKPFGWVRPNEQSLPYGDWFAGQADPLACVFDWCYDQLSDADRKAIGGVLREELVRGPYRTRFHECWWMPAWLSEILALYGAGIDDALAAAALADYNRSIHQFVGVADEIHADGAMGDYHYQYREMMTWPEMWLRATGENLFEKSAFYRAQPEYLLYLIMPAGHWLANDGDGPTDVLGGLSYSFMPDAATFHFYGWRNNQPSARWLARHMQGWPHAGIERRWQAILWADDSRQEKPLRELPPVKFFPSNGVAILRSGWDLAANSTDTVAAFYCRPFESHTHLDAGHFVIWRGLDELAGRGGFYWGTEHPYHHNYFRRTVPHNCLLIHDPDEGSSLRMGRFASANDGGQLPGDPAHYPLSHRLLMGNNPYFYRGEICCFADKPGFTYLFADLTPAYSAAKAGRVSRALLWLKPDSFVICDRLSATKAEFPKRWLLQMANRPTVHGAEKIVAGTSEAGIVEAADAHGAVIARGRSKLWLQTLLPERPLFRRIGGPGYGCWCDGKNWEPPPGSEEKMVEKGRDAAEAALATMRFWRIEIEPAERAADAVFLNVLDVGSADGAAPPAATPLRRDGAVGATLQRAAAHEILFYPDGRVSIDGRVVGQASEPLKPYADSQRGS